MSRKFQWSFVALVVVVGVAAVGYHLANRRLSHTTQLDAPIAASSARAPEFSSIQGAPLATNIASRTHALDARITLSPSRTRATQQYLGHVDNLGRPPYWWLYARSDQEVQWLNQYGFPTPTEEAQLRLSTDAELLNLAALGDKNAKAHIAARALKSAFEKQDDTRALTLQADVRALLAEGGPYQATSVLIAVGEALSAYAQLTDKEKTEKQRKILDQYSDLLPQARFIGELYGDYTFNGIYNSYPAIVARSAIGINDRRQPDASSLASLLAANSRDRQERGDSPLIITTRPRPVLGSESHFSSEQGAIILERK